VYWRDDYENGVTQYSLKGSFIQCIQHPNSGVPKWISQRGLGWKPSSFNRMWERYGYNIAVYHLNQKNFQ